MRSFIWFFPISFFLSISCAPKLFTVDLESNRYEHSSGLLYLELNSDNTFKMESFTDYGCGSIGCGSYELNKDSLFLKIFEYPFYDIGFEIQATDSGYRIRLKSKTSMKDCTEVIVYILRNEEYIGVNEFWYNDEIMFDLEDYVSFSPEKNQHTIELIFTSSMYMGVLYKHSFLTTNHESVNLHFYKRPENCLMKGGVRKGKLKSNIIEIEGKILHKMKMN